MSFAAGVSEAISNATGQMFHASYAHAVSGGDIHAASVLRDGAQRFFVKANRADSLPMFEAEAAALAALAASCTVRIPHVICTGCAADQAFLVLEYLDLHPQGDAARLGEQLAALHRMPQPRFGWTHDNWIGSTPQPNPWADDWIMFWRDQRLGFQLERAARKGYGSALQRDGDVLRAHLADFFAGYRPQPSLLHGDLWGGNHGYLKNGTPVIFDPASYVGDRECDLAMTELFGGYAPDVMAAYRAAWPPDAGYSVRKALYNLYHILNHANLFGGSYVAQATRMSAALLAHVR